MQTFEDLILDKAEIYLHKFGLQNEFSLLPTIFLEQIYCQHFAVKFIKNISIL
jgi:hypothetical protein